MKRVWGVQGAIDSVKVGALAVYKMTHREGFGPQGYEYYVLETEEEMDRFEELVQTAEQTESPEASDVLEDFLRRACGGGLLFGRGGDFVVLYKDGEWLQNPEELLKQEPDSQETEEEYDLEEDYDLFETQQYLRSLEPVFLSVFDPLLGERVSVQKQLLTDPAYYNDTTSRLRELAVSQGLLEVS